MEDRLSIRAEGQLELHGMKMTTGQAFTIDRAAEIVRGAFTPLDCVVETVNLARQIEFLVTHGTQEVFKGTIPAALAQKDYDLRAQIMRARDAIDHQGILLFPWEMPWERPSS